MEIRKCKFKNGAKGAFSFVFDDGCYLPSSTKVIEIFKNTEKSHGVKLIATSAQTVSFLKEENIIFWKKAFKDGWFDLASHSMEHAFAYNEGVPLEKRRFDAHESKKRLEEIYEDMEVISYVNPGGSNTYDGCQVLKECYYGNRSNCEEPPYNDIDTMDLIYVHGFVPNIKYKDLAYYKEFIDTLLEKNAWGVQINHWITDKEQDTFHAQAVSAFELQCDYLGKLYKDGDIWVPSFNEGVKYFKEYQDATLEINEKSATEWEILIKNDLDRKIFTYPLTVEISSCEPVTVIQGDKKAVYEPKDGKVYADIIPNVSATIVK